MTWEQVAEKIADMSPEQRKMNAMFCDYGWGLVEVQEILVVSKNEANEYEKENQPYIVC